MQRRQLRHCSLLIHSTRLRDQIGQILAALGESIQPQRLLTRCLECNAVLEGVSKESLAGLVPPYVYRTQESFKRCPRCGKTYWGGTHRSRIHRRLKRWSAGWEPSRPQV